MGDATAPRVFAIDEFPVMAPAAIEAAWRATVDARRAAREDAFATLLAGDTAAAVAESVPAAALAGGECGASTTDTATAAVAAAVAAATGLHALPPHVVAALPGSGAARVLDASSADVFMQHNSEPPPPPPPHQQQQAGGEAATVVEVAPDGRARVVT